MTDRNHVPPPDAASSPNGAPGREFWLDRDGGQPDDDIEIVPALAVTPDPSLPNLSRQALSDRLFSQYLAAGNTQSVARSLADARALQVIP